MDVLKIFGDREHIFFEMNEGCKVSSVIIIAWLIIFKEVTNKLIFTFSTMVPKMVLNIVQNLVLNSISSNKEMQ